MTVRWNSAGVRAAAVAGAQHGIVAGTYILHAEVVRRIMEPPKSGRIYRRRGVRHQASAPGESPATDTGRLAASVRPDFDDIDQLRGRVTISTAYAEALEVGTAKMAARPYARPSVVAKRAEIEAAVQQGVAAALAGNGGR